MKKAIWIYTGSLFKISLILQQNRPILFGITFVLQSRQWLKSTIFVKSANSSHSKLSIVGLRRLLKLIGFQAMLTATQTRTTPIDHQANPTGFHSAIILWHAALSRIDINSANFFNSSYPNFGSFSNRASMVVPSNMSNTVSSSVTT